MTTREQLYASIVAAPDDDTVRLAYADHLDEQDDHDRAEFIRVQVAIDGVPLRRSPEMPYVEWERQKKRADELLAAHPEWRDCPCPRCEGDGKAHGSDRPFDGVAACPVCGGTGDLLRVDRRHEDITLTETSCQRPHQFARGFIDSVTLTFREMFRYEPYRILEGVPMPLLLALVRSLPLTRVYLSDVVVHPSGGNDTYYVGGLGLLPSRHWHELQNHRTPQAARDALARVVCRLAREIVFKQ